MAKGAATAVRRSARLGVETVAKALAEAPKATKAAVAAAPPAKAKAAPRPGPVRHAHATTAGGASAYAEGFDFAFGVDEVGRGCLAGAVVACACYLPPAAAVEGVTDSKKIPTEEAREAVRDALVAAPGLRYALAKAEAPVVDELNILNANLACMRAASEALAAKLASGAGSAADDGDIVDVTAAAPDEAYDSAADASDDEALTAVALVDGVDDPWRYHPRARRGAAIAVRTVKGGDAGVPAISAASVIAKVARDRLVNALAADYPEYDWASNKAYGTHAHRAAIVKHGWVDGVHRTSFDPVRSILAGGGANKRAAKRAAKPAANKPAAAAGRAKMPAAKKPAAKKPAAKKPAAKKPAGAPKKRPRRG